MPGLWPWFRTTLNARRLRAGFPTPLLPVGARRMPLAIALALLVTLACGRLVHARAWMISTALGSVLAAGYAWPRLSLAGTSATLRFSRSRIREGHPVTIELTLRNRLPWGAWGLVLHPEGTPAEQAWAVVRYLPGWCTRRFQLEFTPRLRGVYPDAGLVLSTGFPFGFGSGSVRVQVPQRLIVWPRTWPVGPLPAAAPGRDDEEACLLTRPGCRGDIFALRPYRRGDPLRSIHWIQTARHDRLIVCERQAPAHTAVTIVLDTAPAHHSGSGCQSTLERAIRAAASLCQAWIEEGGRVGLIAGERSIAPGTGPSHGRLLLDTLARLPAAGLSCRPDHPGGIAFLVTTDRGAAAARVPLRRDRVVRVIALRSDPSGGDRGDEDDMACVRRALK